MISIHKDLFDSSKIRDVYQRYIIPDVRNGIETALAREPKPNLTVSEKIVISFLKEYFVNEKNEVSSDRIALYLYDATLTDPHIYLDSIILFYWRCAIRIWVDKLNLTIPTDEEIKTLSQWRAIKKRAQEQRKPEARRNLVTSVITDSTYLLFSNVTKADILAWNLSTHEISDKEIELIDFLPELQGDLFGDSKNENALTILENIFDYGKLNRKLVRGSPRHQLLSAMNVPVCPYCNRQYITIYTDSEGDKTTADLDHFYIKSNYPYLALSLYNFIPSCQICNSRFKGTTDFYLYPHIYPYTQDFGRKARFTVKLDPCLLDDSSNWDEISMIELVDESKTDAIANSISTFSLEEVYQSHIDYVQEIWFKSRMYNSDMLYTLGEEFSKLFDTERSIADLVFGQYLEYSKLYKRPLSKLTRDILMECYGEEFIEKYM